MKSLNSVISNIQFFLTYFGLINAIPQEYKMAIKRTGLHQEHPTQPWDNLKALTTKAIHKSFVKHIFEDPTTPKQRLVANGLKPDKQILQLSFLNHYRNEVNYVPVQNLT